MTKYYICVLPGENLTVGKRYVSYQPDPGFNPKATWVNVVDDSGFIHSHSNDLLKSIEEVRQDKLTALLDEDSLYR